MFASFNSDLSSDCDNMSREQDNNMDSTARPTRSWTSIFEELFARLQKDLRHLKSDSKEAAGYSENVGKQLDEWKSDQTAGMKTRKSRGSFLARLSFSRRRSSKLSKAAQEACMASKSG